MKTDMVSSRRKVSLVLIIVLSGICLLILIPAVWCWQVTKVFRPNLAPDNFPNTDIVYTGVSGLEFINADGSGRIAVPLVTGYTDFVGGWQSPLITGDGKTILVTHTSVPGYPGKIFAVSAGEKPIDCGWHGTIQIASDGSHVLESDIGGGIYEYLPKDCGTGNLPVKGYGGISGALSPDEQYVAYSINVDDAKKNIEPTIILHHIPSGEKRVIGVGDFPVWSRDGKWLAYTGEDGIYIVQNNPKSEPKRLVSIESPNPSLSVPSPVYQEDRFIEYYPPIASWSPDGEWLVYHVYSYDLVAPESGAWAGHYSIFKVNLITGETMKLLDGGYSPFWRWPVEEP